MKETIKYLDTENFPCRNAQEERALVAQLEGILAEDFHGNFFSMMGAYQRVLADRVERKRWDGVHEKLSVLFKCGKSVVVDGPMVGIPLAIRDSDYLKSVAAQFGRKRSIMANCEWMATAWNATFADTGLWMGKTFEPISREKAVQACRGNKKMMEAYHPNTTRVGRNFFREPTDRTGIRAIGLPGLQMLWRLKDRPQHPGSPGYWGDILASNLEKETNIPYTKTGGIFLAAPGSSVVPEMNGKKVYQLNYRWPELDPVFPMTRLVDELVQIADGVYLGQLVFATRNYSLGTLRMKRFFKGKEITLGEPYRPHVEGMETPDYGYQNNGFFLMMDPTYAEDIYKHDAFPQLKPHIGESGYENVAAESLNATPTSCAWHEVSDWVTGWRRHPELNRKFSTLCLEPSPKGNEEAEVRQLLRGGESVLQMLQRISNEISTTTCQNDSIAHFEKLNQIFRCGVAPEVRDGLFQGQGKGFNTRATGKKSMDWYGQKMPASGFDYYHGATLNLHLGFADTFFPDPFIEDDMPFPITIADLLRIGKRGPNLLNMVWHSLGKYIFPWAGKSFERVNGRKLSMLLDESDNLKKRYPKRVRELRRFVASAPHYALVKKNQRGDWHEKGMFDERLQNGSWDKGMTEEDRAFWDQEASKHWVYGNNLQDRRILPADALFRMLDMNYRVPDPWLQSLSEATSSPFVRQGYSFLGVSDRTSILAMNNGPSQKKKVFQFHYRYPMIGGPAPIGLCLDELVEVAEGLFLGQLIYATVLDEPFHSSVDPARYKYQLFGYFLLMDDVWELHRKAIKLDIIH